jgi:hypothetical protein
VEKLRFRFDLPVERAGQRSVPRGAHSMASRLPVGTTEEEMSVKRNEFNREKRIESNRDFRRAHLQGAARLVQNCERHISSFKGRMLAALNRLFA